MKNKMSILLICLIISMFISSITIAEGDSCDANRIISENQRVNELEGQKTREYMDATLDAFWVDAEKWGWDWLGAVKIFVTEQVKKLVITFAISIFGAILVINAIAGIIFLRLQRNKFVLLNAEISRLAYLCEPKKEDEKDIKKKGGDKKQKADFDLDSVLETICNAVIVRIDARVDSKKELPTSGVSYVPSPKLIKRKKRNNFWFLWFKKKDDEHKDTAKKSK